MKIDIKDIKPYEFDLSAGKMNPDDLKGYAGKQTPDMYKISHYLKREVIDCNKHDNPVINRKLREVTLEEGMKIAKELFEILAERGDGIGLAANQVGIDAHVAVVSGSAFGTPECIRISYAASEENIKEAIRRIKKSLLKLI